MAEEFEGEGEAFEPDPEEVAEPIPLPPEERESVEADLEDLAAMRGVFETQGAKGVVISCSECGSNHYYGWDLLRESLEHMLDTGEPRMHEPAFQPREDDYVVWDYGKGYVDALADAGLDAEPHVEITACGWCNRVEIDGEWHLAPHSALLKFLDARAGEQVIDRRAHFTGVRRAALTVRLF